MSTITPELAKLYEQWYEWSRTPQGREGLVEIFQQAASPFTCLSSVTVCLADFMQADHTPSSSSSSLSVSTMNKMLLMLRNVCAASSNSTYVDLLIEYDVIAALFALARHFSLFSGTDYSSDVSSTPSESVSKLILALCQCLANISAINGKSVDHIMDQHRGKLSDVLACALKSDGHKSKSLAASMTLLYNCICSSKTGHEGRFQQLLEEEGGVYKNRLLFCQLMLSIYPSLSSKETETQPSDEPHLEWINLLVLDWTLQDRVVTVYKMLTSTKATTSELKIEEESESESIHASLITVEQLTFLYVISNLLEHNGTSLPDHIQSFLLESKANGSLLQECLKSLSQVYKSALAMSSNESALSRLDSYYRTIYLDYVLIVMSMIAFFLSQCNQVIDTLKRECLAEKANLFDNYKTNLCTEPHNAVEVIAFLLSSSTLIINEHGKDAAHITGNSSKELEFHREVIKLSLQILSNLVYRNRLGQTKLLETTIINHVLSHCGTNFSNPLSREWALLCVRNACEGNEEVQTYIDSLTLQETLDLRQQGMKIEIDGKRGKFKFVQTTEETSIQRN